MAKAVVPLEAFRQRYGQMAPEAMAPFLHDLVARFLHETAKDPKHPHRDDERPGKG